MDNTNRSTFRVGLLMLGSVALIVCVIIGIKGMSFFKERTHTHLIGFDLKTDIGGLRVGDEVRIGGFKVGEIQRISLERLDDPNNPPGLVVAFSIPVKYVLHEDARVRIGGTVTGTSWLNFDDLGRGKALADGGLLVGGPSALTELFNKVGAMGPEVQTLLTDVRTKTLPGVNATVDRLGQAAEAFKKTGENTTALTADVRATYKPIIERYNAVADKAVAMMEAIRALFGDTTDDFRTTVANLRKSTDSLKAKLPGILEKVDGTLAKVETTVDGLNKTMVDVQATMASAKDLAAGAKAVIVGNRTKLDTMIASLKTTGDNLKAATAEIRRSPWRLLYKPAPNEMANLNLYDAARQFSEGANDLNDAAGALRDAIKNNQGSPEELKKLMERVDQSFGNFKQVEEKLWGSVK